MRYVAAYMLAVLGGKDSPTEADLKTILESVGVGFEKDRASIVVSKLKGKDLNQLIEEGKRQMSSMPAGGAVAVAAGGAAPAAAPAAAAPAAKGGAAPAKEEPKKKEEAKKKEESEGSDDDMGFGLFD